VSACLKSICFFFYFYFLLKNPSWLFGTTHNLSHCLFMRKTHPLAGGLNRWPKVVNENSVTMISLEMNMWLQAGQCDRILGLLLKLFNCVNNPLVICGSTTSKVFSFLFIFLYPSSPPLGQTIILAASLFTRKTTMDGWVIFVRKWNTSKL